MKLTIYNSNAIITLIDKIIKLEKTYLKTPVIALTGVLPIYVIVQ